MFAFHLRVAVISGRAETGGPVRNSSAHGVLSASSGLEAGDDAATLLAALVHSAVLVLFALVLDALGGRIAAKAAWTEADGLVVRHATSRVTTTGRLGRTGIDALAVDAGLISGAVRSGLAASGADAGLAKLPGRTLAIGRAFETAAALLARLTAAAVCRFRAGLGAETGRTSSTGPAFGGGRAAGRRQRAAYLRVSDGSGWAAALSRVIDHFADGAASANVWNATRIGALVIDASLIGRASAIVSAAHHADPIAANVSAIAVSVAVAHRATNSVEASRIGEAALVTANGKIFKNVSAKLLD